METSAVRGAVFAEIKRKNALYRVVDALYSRAGAHLMQPLALFVYMLKSILSLGPFEIDDAEAVSVSSFENEWHSLDRVLTLVPDITLLRLSLTRGHLLGCRQLRAAYLMLVRAPRIWPFLSRLVRSYNFMPSARIASALAYYIRFVHLFAEDANLATAIVASNYSPEAVGLAAAAHRMGRRVIYINHAPVPANAPWVPPVLADCAILYGEAIKQTYLHRSCCTAEVAVIGQPWTARPMEWRGKVGCIGIFLTALTRADVVYELVSAIRRSHPEVRIVIRNHPVALLRTDFSDLEQQDPKVDITIGNPLDDEIVSCDFIICGNSGVALNALSSGRPVAYMDQLDGLNFDYNGFVANGLVCHVTGWDDEVYTRLKRFYQNPAWQSIMRSYDASYGGDATELENAAADMIRRYIGQA